MKSSTGKVEIKAFRLSHGLGLPLPQYQTEEAAGMDLMAAVPLTSPLRLLPGMRQLVPTGLTIEIPPGFEGQVRPRSGLALNHGVTVLNAPGTVDSDYRGEIKVLLVNLGRETFVVTRGQRIAQLVIQAVSRAEMIDVRAVAASRRGDAGFGSTGLGGGSAEVPRPAFSPAPKPVIANASLSKAPASKAPPGAPFSAAMRKPLPVASAPIKSAALAKAPTAAKAKKPSAPPAKVAPAKPGIAKAAQSKPPIAKKPMVKPSVAKPPLPKQQSAKRPAPVATKSKASARA